jgi:hypothetical protein
MLQHLAWLVAQLCDDPRAVPNAQLDDVFPHIAVARDTLTTYLNHYQLLASCLDVKTASALADAAVFNCRVASHGDSVLAGLPIACPHLAELFADFRKKAMAKSVKALHDPPQAKSGKPAALPDDGDTNSLHTQLEKSEAHAKKLEARLADSGRKNPGSRDPKVSDPERPPDPKKTDKPKSSNVGNPLETGAGAVL